MNFIHVAELFERLEKISSRNQTTLLLAQLFKDATPQEALILCNLSLGQLNPPYVGTKFNIATSLLTKTLATLLEEPLAQVEKKAKELGDLGLVVCQGHWHQHTNKPSIVAVYQELQKLEATSGSGSQEKKITTLAAFLKKLDPLSAKYMIRMILGKLRLGFSDMTLVDALSWMEAGDKSLRPVIEQAYNICADIGHIAYTLKKSGSDAVRSMDIVVGIPIRPAAAERLPTPQAIVEKLIEDKGSKEFKARGKDALLSRAPGSKKKQGKKDLSPEKDASVSHKAEKNECSLEHLYADFEKTKNLDYCVAQPKLDGFRLQIHLSKRGHKKPLVRFFSRNLQDMSAMFPDLVDEISNLAVEDMICDSEAIVYDPTTGDFLPFQETVKRKRKHAVTQTAADLPLQVFIFDLLYVNGKSLLEKSHEERRSLMLNIFDDGVLKRWHERATKKGEKSHEGHTGSDKDRQTSLFHHDAHRDDDHGNALHHADSSHAKEHTCLHHGTKQGKGSLGSADFKVHKIVRHDESVPVLRIKPIDEYVIHTAKELKDYFAQTIDAGLEGVVVKRPDAHYQPGKRNFNWIKLKRHEEKSALEDTLDCVLLGYYAGQGKRTGFGIGAFLVGLYNKKLDRFETCAKVGTGLSDQNWRELKKKADTMRVAEKPHNVVCDKDLYPDVWVNPEIVIAIRADNITESPVHTAGKTTAHSGYGLRFPRFIVYREDKSAQDATTTDELKRIYEHQGKKE